MKYSNRRYVIIHCYLFYPFPNNIIIYNIIYCLGQLRIPFGTRNSARASQARTRQNDDVRYMTHYSHTLIVQLESSSIAQDDDQSIGTFLQQKVSQSETVFKMKLPTFLLISFQLVAVVRSFGTSSRSIVRNSVLTPRRQIRSSKPTMVVY